MIWWLIVHPSAHVNISKKGCVLLVDSINAVPFSLFKVETMEKKENP